MLLRYWLNDVFCNEATDAGEGAGGTAAEASPHTAKLADWVAERTGTEDTPITTEATATTADPLVKEIPVETTSTDAVSDDDAASQEGEETGLDPLLMSVAEAYDYTSEDVKGFNNEGLKRLLARERRLRGEVAAAAEPTKTADSTTADVAPAKVEVAPVVKADTNTATFADYQATLEEKLSEEGLSDVAIQREVKLAKARWDREEAILVDARHARTEAEQMRQELHRQKADYARNLEVNFVLDVVDQFARDGLSVVGMPDAEWSEAEKAARTKVVQAYDALKATNPGVPVKRLATLAIDVALHEEIAKREAKSHARALINQSNRVVAAGMPAQSTQQESGNGKRDWMRNPKIARIARKHQINVG